MDKLFTGYYDANGVGIYIGDALRSAEGVDVIVTKADDAICGTLVSTNSGAAYSKTPINIHEGNGYVVIEVSDAN